MLKTLILKNFKAFGTRQVIPLAPITLLFGANSAGKSSILQSLLLLKQTLEHEGRNESELLLRGPFVDLGSFRDVIFRHDVTEFFEVSMHIHTSDHGNDVKVGQGFVFHYSDGSNLPEFLRVNQYHNNTLAYSIVDNGNGTAEIFDLEDEHPLWKQAHEYRMQTPYAAKLRTALAALAIVMDGKTEDSGTAWKTLNSCAGLLENLTGKNILPMLPKFTPHRAQAFHKRVSNELNRLEQYTLAEFIEEVRTLNTEQKASTVRVKQFLPTRLYEPLYQREDEGNDVPKLIMNAEWLAEWMEFPISKYSTVPNLGLLTSAMGVEIERILDQMVYLGHFVRIQRDIT